MKKQINRLLAFFIACIMLVQIVPANVIYAVAIESESIAETVVGDDVKGVQRAVSELMQIDGVQLDDNRTRVISIDASARSEMTADEIAALLNSEKSTDKARNVPELEMSICAEFSLSAAQTEAAVKAHGEESEYFSELDTLLGFEKYHTVSAADRGEIIDLINLGVSANDAIALNIAIDFFELDRAAVVDAYLSDVADEEGEDEQDYEDDLREEIIYHDDCYALSIRTSLPLEIVQDVLDSSSKTCEILMNEYVVEWESTYAFVETKNSQYMPSDEMMKESDSKEASGSKASVQSAGLDGFSPERLLEGDFSYYNRDNLKINLNTGTYTYSETDLSLPGKNGLDLNFTRMYNSTSAAIAVPYGFYESSASNKVAVEVGYDIYKYDLKKPNSATKVTNSLVRIIEPTTDAIVQGVAFKYQGTGYVYTPLGNIYPNTILGAMEYYNDLCEETDALYSLFAADGMDEAAIVMPRMTPVNSSYFVNNTAPYDYHVKNFGLGHGWSIGFSSIESYLTSCTNSYGELDITSINRLNLPDGRSLEIRKNGNGFEEYLLNDINISKSNSVGQERAGAVWKVTYRDGKREYFDSKGNIIAILDAYDNEINFQYTYNGLNVTKIVITDTLGREIIYQEEVLSPTTNLKLPTVHGNISHNVKWTLHLNGTLIREYYSSISSNGLRALCAVVDEKGDCTKYTTSKGTSKFNVFLPGADTNSDKSIGIAILTNVRYPDGSTFSFGAPSTERIGISGHMPSAVVINKAKMQYKFKYENIEYRIEESYKLGDIYHFDPVARHLLSEEYDYRTQITRTASCYRPSEASFLVYDYSKEEVYFDEQHRMLQEKSYAVDVGQEELGNTTEELKELLWRRQQVLSSVTNYAYDWRNLPIHIATTQYNHTFGNTPAGSSTTTRSYVYNSYGEVTSQTQPNGQTITFTYDNTYGLPLTTSYQKDANTSVVETNVLTADKKGIAQSSVAENGTIIKKQTYTYYSDGSLAGTKEYIDLTTYQETQYEYDTSAAPTVVKTIGVKDAFGALVPGSPGYTDGTLVTETTYDERGRIASITDARGNVSSYAYDIAGRLTGITNADGSESSYAYDFGYESGGNVTNKIVFTNELGHEIEYRYNAMGKLLGIFDVTNNVLLEENQYDHMMHLMRKTIYSSETEPVTYYYHYDSDDRVIEMGIHHSSVSRTPLESYTYLDGQRIVIHTLHGQAGAPSTVTKEYYDVMGNLIKSAIVVDGIEKSSTFRYDYLGNLIETKSAFTAEQGGSYTSRYTYSALGNVLSATDASGVVSYNTYDWLGRVETATDNKGNVSAFTYDAANRLVRETHPFEDLAESETVYTYDQAGNVTAQKQTNNLPAQSSTYSQIAYSYDSMNRVTQVANIDSGNDAVYTKYDYDALGNVLHQYTGLTSPIVDNSSGYAVTTYEYDTLGRCVSSTDALGQTEQYAYDINGNLRTKQDRNGITTSYSYDKMGNLLSSTAGNSDSLSYTYYPNGILKSESGGGITTTYTYNDMGLVASASQSDGVMRTYTYDSAGNRLSMTLKKDAVTQLQMTYTYDVMGRLYQVKENGTTIATYTYDANGNRATLTYANGDTTSYSYNHANLVTALQNKKDGATLSSYTYSYYLDGNQRSKLDDSGKITTYSYDGLGRLTQEQESTGQSYAYTYDAFSNRERMTADGAENYVTDYIYDLNNRLLAESKEEGEVTQLTEYDYDANGNTISTVSSVLTSAADDASALEAAAGLNGVTLYEYDGFNRQTSVQTGESIAEYSYLANGMRHSKTVDGITTTHIWDGSNIIADVVDDTVTAKYLRGIGLIAADFGTARSYYLYNAHGDVTGLTDASGTVTQKYDYDAFGNEQEVTGYPTENDPNPFRYCGEYLDAETGTYYLRARYYSPQIGRFTQMDSVLGMAREMPNGQKITDPLSLNLYTYCANNPIAYYDPSGHFWETVLDICGIIWSAADMINSPSWSNLGLLLWDIGATVLPFVPGSYTAKGGKLLIKTAGKADDVVDAFKALSKADRLASAGGGNLIMGYKNLKKIVKGLGLEVHHLLEKRFAKTLGLKADDILSIAIDKNTHQSITNAMRKALPYDTLFTKHDYSAQEIWKATVDVYTNLGLTEYLPALKEQLLDSASNVGKITDWLGW